MEGMELSDLYKTYGKIKKNQATPRQLFKIIVYASMNRLYSSRDIETACRRDVNFMYLLEGKPAYKYTKQYKNFMLINKIIIDIKNILCYYLGVGFK